MIDWLKYFPFAMRYDHNPAEVRGPYFTKPKLIKWRFGDCVLHFRAPRSNSVAGITGRGCSVDAIPAPKGDILKILRPNFEADNWDNPRFRWKFDLLFRNNWFFVGPWFTGIKARLTLRANIISVSELSKFSGKNFFHPAVFESAIADVLDCLYGHHKFNTKKRAHFRGPLNWKVQPISNSIKAVVCDIHTVGNSGKENPELARQMYIPITPNRLLLIDLDFGGTKIYNDDVCAKPLFNLCNSIIDSIRLDVGPETQAEWDKVKATCPDMSITETFGELQWPLAPEKPPKEKRELDITPQSAGFEKLRSI
ncbi:hypothetical protein [Saccharophagus degradans]|uniref:Uncharacterized protein n=1 Tax=Saccharophagus degradans (strain 2-40 / ATCC 43961 / DSM 17024) TaxID=203122 RepID=Q21NI3_SACD2|nr:hypothetical protein [Saccharophagus degradans]ABD79746.1 conserved hypothetical protein [Saccharophagus degradans 2-40]